MASGWPDITGWPCPECGGEGDIQVSMICHHCHGSGTDPAHALTPSADLPACRDEDPAHAATLAAAYPDPHYDQPPSDAIEDQPRTSLPDQRRGIYIALGKHGIKDFRSAIERLVRRDITDPKDMSYNEAVMVRARVDSWDGRTEELLAPLMERNQADA